LARIAWLWKPHNHQNGDSLLVQTSVCQQPDFWRTRASSGLPFDWLFRATLATLSLRQGRDPFLEPVRGHAFHPRLVGRTQTRTQRTKCWGMGRASTCFLPCIGRVGRELFRPARPRQPSRHASSAASCEGRAGRGWLARGAWRERSGRQTATRLAPPPPQHAPSSNFSSPISCSTDSGRRRAGRHPPLRIKCGPARATPALCPGGGVWSGRRGAAWPCALAVYCRGAQWRPA